jgi:hypothetical protein
MMRSQLPAVVACRDGSHPSRHAASMPSRIAPSMAGPSSPFTISYRVHLRGPGLPLPSGVWDRTRRWSRQSSLRSLARPCCCLHHPPGNGMITPAIPSIAVTAASAAASGVCRLRQIRKFPPPTAFCIPKL